MERDHGRGLKHQHQHQQQQVAWTPGHNFGLSGCFSWPAVPQPLSSSYTCGYCKREFRSAQALGGHMNVHRRDRARLRQCCPAYAPSPNLIAAHHLRAAAAGPPLPNLNFVPPHCAGATTAEPVVYSFFSTTTTSAMKAAVQVNLELGISGGFCGHDGAVPEEGGLDLELRLGCPLE